MRLTRYRVMISATTHEFLLSVQQVMARDQAHAEGRATNLLRARRIIAPEGTLWDRWDIGVKLPGERDYTHVATGDHNGTKFTTRAISTRERRRGEA